MSFDPLTGIWAAKKAAEVVGGSGGSGWCTSIPIIEITTDFLASVNSNGVSQATLTESETAQIISAKDTSNYAFLSFMQDGFPTTLVAKLTDVDGIQTYIARGNVDRGGFAIPALFNVFVMDGVGIAMASLTTDTAT